MAQASRLPVPYTPFTHQTGSRCQARCNILTASLLAIALQYAIFYSAIDGILRCKMRHFAA